MERPILRQLNTIGANIEFFYDRNRFTMTLVELSMTSKIGCFGSNN